MSQMTAGEALTALKPLTTMFRAVQRLEDLLTYAHQVEGVLPGIEAEITKAKAEAATSKAAAEKSMDRDRKRMADAGRNADEAIAALKAKVDAAEAAAAERCNAAEVQTTAKLEDLRAKVRAAEARLDRLKHEAQDAEAALERATALRAEALKALGGGA